MMLREGKLITGVVVSMAFLTGGLPQVVLAEEIYSYSNVTTLAKLTQDGIAQYEIPNEDSKYLGAISFPAGFKIPDNVTVSISTPLRVGGKVTFGTGAKLRLESDLWFENDIIFEGDIHFVVPEGKNFSIYLGGIIDMATRDQNGSVIGVSNFIVENSNAGGQAAKLRISSNGLEIKLGSYTDNGTVNACEVKIGQNVTLILNNTKVSGLASSSTGAAVDGGGRINFVDGATSKLVLEGGALDFSGNYTFTTGTVIGRIASMRLIAYNNAIRFASNSKLKLEAVNAVVKTRSWDLSDDTITFEGSANVELSNAIILHYVSFEIIRKP